ncbi:MAG: universal stress protein [Bacteroidota bacterium]|nr:universal stress protein [Bacteroidota bacterium]
MKKQKIIVGIDYTKSSVNALNYAKLLAYHSNSELILFHLYDAPVLYTNSGLYLMSYKAVEKSNKEKLNLFAKKYIDDKVAYSTIATSGAFKDEVNGLAKSNNIHSVVLGLESKTKMNRFIFGSTTTDVAGKIDCPVIIVPESYKKHAVGHTIIAFDNSELPNAKCMKKIRNFINTTQSKISVYHIKTPNEIIESKNDSFKIDANLSYKIQVKKSKSLIDGIKSVVTQNKANAIIDIARKHSFVYRFFNESHTKEIAFASKVPVVVVHE